MITHFATRSVLVHVDILSKLIWAVKTVRVNPFKPKAL